MADFSTKLQKLKNANLYRQVKTPLGSAINFCSNDYLGLKNHAQVIEAFKQGADQFGVGAGGSHLIGGHTLAHETLEKALAAYLGQERALLFSTGYMANLGVFSALQGELDWVLQDKLNHASLLDANHLIRLPLQRYLHNNMDALKQKIGKQSGQGLIATDSVFSMDGDQADIDSIASIATSENALLMQDDAHGFGVFTPNIPKNSIYMATLGKAAGTMGAFVAGSADFIDFLVQKSRCYIYTTAIAPALCVASLQSLKLIEQGQLQKQLLANIAFFQKFSKALELPIMPSNSAIMPLIVGDNKKALEIANKLLDSGFYVKAIRPPTVPNNTARLRITLNATHTQTQIERLLTALKNAL